MTDLVERLRERDAVWQRYCDDWMQRSKELDPSVLENGVEDQIRKTIYAEAADALEAAQAQAAEVRRETAEALKPFAEYMEGGLDRDHHGDLLPGDHGVGWVYLTHADFRRAAAAIRALTDAAKGDRT